MNQFIGTKMFSWKDRSAEIYSTIFENLNNANYRDGADDADSDDDIEDVKKADRTAFEISSIRRKQMLLLNPENDQRLQKWRDLTNIETTPVLPPRKTSSFSHSAQCLLKQRSNTPEKMPTVLKTIPKKTNEILDNTNFRESVLSFKIQYLPVSGKLKVTIEQGSNLFDEWDSVKRIATNVNMCLMPGKIQRQSTTVVRETRSPKFTSVLYFTGFSLYDLQKKCLRVKVNSRKRMLRPLKTMSEITVRLDNLDLLRETHIDQPINHKILEKCNSC